MYCWTFSDNFHSTAIKMFKWLIKKLKFIRIFSLFCRFMFKWILWRRTRRFYSLLDAFTTLCRFNGAILKIDFSQTQNIIQISRRGRKKGSVWINTFPASTFFRARERTLRSSSSDSSFSRICRRLSGIHELLSLFRLGSSKCSTSSSCQNSSLLERVFISTNTTARRSLHNHFQYWFMLLITKELKTLS